MTSQRIELPVRAKRVRKPYKELKEELYERLKRNEAVCEIFRAYKVRTKPGYPTALFGFLWCWVCPPYQFSPKTAKRTVDRLADAITEFRRVMGTYLKEFPPDALNAQVDPFLAHFVEVRVNLDMWYSVTHEDHRPRPSGRPPGVSFPNFAAAVIAKEFRKVFGRPRWGDIAMLIEAVDPSRFAKIKEEENLPGEALRWCDHRIRTNHAKAVNKLWKGVFGSTANWPPSQFDNW